MFIWKLLFTYIGNYFLRVGVHDLVSKCLDCDIVILSRVPVINFIIISRARYSKFILWEIPHPRDSLMSKCSSSSPVRQVSLGNVRLRRKANFLPVSHCPWGRLWEEEKEEEEEGLSLVHDAMGVHSGESLKQPTNNPHRLRLRQPFFLVKNTLAGEA